MKPALFGRSLLLGVAIMLLSIPGLHGGQKVPRFRVYEQKFETTGSYTNPYVEVEGRVAFTSPTGQSVGGFLFWDGGSVWKFRFAPDQTGVWQWEVTSSDTGLQGRKGTFECVPSENAGGIRPMTAHGTHFERQNGDPFWFFGDTAWALFTDSVEEKHNREAAERHIETRAQQGFNVLHAMLLSEAGWGNRGGMPFHDIAAEQINPAYWREVDERIAFANSQGMVCGLAIAWGDKSREEPFAWSKFPSVEARKRHARHMGARFGGHNVYFILSGEWHAEVSARQSTEAAVKKEFISEIGPALQAADPHRRMIGMHPMTSHGSVREFNEARWMSFGDYQQNYDELHARVLQSLRFNKPVVNSEYGYHLRDQNGDGQPDKENSTTTETIRHATWDILMAGGYIVTGFGTTYFGGNRDPGPFDVEARRNDDWEEQIQVTKKVFSGVEWWKLKPHDELLSCSVPRGKDRKHLNEIAPPKTAYWCLADPGSLYVSYGRGVSEPVSLKVTPAGAKWRRVDVNPLDGSRKETDVELENETFTWQPLDEREWVVVILKKM